MRLLDATVMVLITVAIEQIIVAQGIPGTVRFEVVSVRPVGDEPFLFKLSEAGQRLFHITTRGGLVGRADLSSIIRVAYGLAGYERIVAAEPSASRILQEHFEIEALPPEAPSPPTRDQVQAMTRQMLADRFGLKVRLDSELTNATVLRVIKPGILGRGVTPAPSGCTQLPPRANAYDPKFAEAYVRKCGLSFFGDRIRGTVTLDEFTRSISALAERPILNRTGLEGMFAIDVAVADESWIPRPGSLGGPLTTGQTEAPAFVDALRDQMGLSAGTERQPIQLLIVEHVGPLVEN